MAPRSPYDGAVMAAVGRPYAAGVELCSMIVGRRLPAAWFRRLSALAVVEAQACR